MRSPTQLVRLLLIPTLMTAIHANPAASQGWFRMEAGLGFGMVGEGGGLNGRLAAGLSGEHWGGLARRVVHDGGEGRAEPCSFICLGDGTVAETFHETSLLVTRSLTGSNLLLDAGIGRMSGRRLDPDGRGLVEIPATWGVPVELAYYGARNLGLIGAFILSAHLNREASQFGAMASIGLGLR